MLLRLVGKLLFKATLPLIAVAGVLTYGVYMRGGDPGALWKGVANSTVGQTFNVMAGLKNDASRAAAALSSQGAALAGGESTSDRALTTVYTWQDSQGVTHYSSSQPGHAQARTVTVDPDVNVLAPVSTQPVPSRSATGTDAVTHESLSDGLHGRPSGDMATARQRGSSTYRDSQANNDDLQEVSDVLGGTLPGVAGQVLSTSSGNQGALDPAQLIRMLQ